MLETLKKLYDLFTPRERRRLALVFIAVLGTAAVEVGGIASIMPFLSMVTNPEMIHENKYLSWAYNFFGFQSNNRFLVFSGGLVLIIITISNTFAAITMWGVARFTWMRNHALSKRLLKKYLHSPYSYFLDKNTSDMGKNTLDEVRQVILGVLRPGLNTVAKGIIALAIFALLLFTNPWLALLITVVLGGTYGVIYALVRKKLKQIGERRYAANEERFKAVNEAFGGIKLLKLLGMEDTFLERYADASLEYSNHQATRSIINRVPRYLIEIIAFGGLLVIILFLLLRGEGLQQVLPLTGLYAFAGYRLKPQIQRVFQGFTRLRYNAPALKSLYKDLEPETGSKTSGKMNKDFGRRTSDLGPLPFRDSLKLESITYTYPNAQQPVIQDLDLEIEAHTSVAFAGETGAGKTTIADIILGLLRPDEGEMLVDGTEVTDQNLHRWQANLGYVPQEIYLQDATVADNIAFGVDSEDIDQNKVVQAAKMANIHEFVADEMPKGYDTMVGERGVRLSGGQAQRVGIARALYHDPEVLVLDEATSDLDNVTERKVHEAIENVAKAKTLIVIAHRLSTIEDSDQIYFLDQGKIVDSGTFDELLTKSDDFRSMADMNA